MILWLIVLLICERAVYISALRALRVGSLGKIKHAEHAGDIGNQPTDCWITEKKESYNIQFKIKASFSCNFFKVFSNQKLSKADWQTLVVMKTFHAKMAQTKKGRDACVCLYNEQLSHIFSPGKFAGERDCDPKSCFRAYSALMYVAARQTRDKSIHPGEIHTATHWTVSADGNGDTTVPLLREEVDKLKQAVDVDTEELDIVLARAGAVRDDELSDRQDEDEELVDEHSLGPNDSNTPTLKNGERGSSPRTKKPTISDPSAISGKTSMVEDSISSDDPILFDEDFDVEEFLKVTDQRENEQDADESEEVPENLGKDRHVQNPDSSSLTMCKEVIKVIWKLSKESGSLSSCPCSSRNCFETQLYQVREYLGYAYMDPSTQSLSERDWSEACTNFGDFLSKGGRQGRIGRRIALLHLADSAYVARATCKECDINQLEYTTMSFVNTLLPAVIRPGTMDSWQPRTE